MNTFEINKYYVIDDLITLVKNKKDRDIYYAIYVKNNSSSLSCGMNVFVGPPIEFDDNDNEVTPKVILNESLEFGYARDQFQDVIDLAVKQNQYVTSGEIISCLNYYDEHDDFLDIGAM